MIFCDKFVMNTYWTQVKDWTLRKELFFLMENENLSLIGVIMLHIDLRPSQAVKIGNAPV